jgi:hypothetical protein
MRPIRIQFAATHWKDGAAAAAKDSVFVGDSPRRFFRDA